MTTPHPPGPWQAKPSDRERSWFVVRPVAPGRFQFLGEDGRPVTVPSRFPSQDGAHAAIARAEGRS